MIKCIDIITETVEKQELVHFFFRNRLSKLEIR